MFKPMLGFIIGVILLYFSGDLINSSKYSLNYYIGLQAGLGGFCILSLFYYLCANRLCRHLILFFVFFIFGFFYAFQSIQNIKNASLPAHQNKVLVTLTAYLCGLPIKGEFSYSADFCLTKVLSESGESLPGSNYKAKLRWPLNTDLTEGLLVLNIQAQQARSTVNFIGVSYETRLLYERIVLIGSVQEVLAVRPTVDLDLLSRLRYQYHQTRKLVKQYSDSLLKEVPQQGIIHALLLGDRSHITGEHHKVLANTGTQHLIAISGLHVGLVMFGIYWLLPKSKTSVVIVVSLGLLYVMLVGFSPSAQRAWLMCIGVLLYLSGYWNLGKWRVYTFTLCAVLLWDPLATLNLGFWYSFLCVGILFLLSQTLSIQSKPLLALLVFQVLLLVGMIPIASILGMKHGFENILANSLAIPWVSLLVLPLTLCWFALSFMSDALSLYLLRLLNISIDLQMTYLSSLRIVNIPLNISIQWQVLLSFSGCFIVLLVFNRIRTIYAMCMLGLSLAILFPSRLDRSEPEFLVFDVGQGLAIAFKSKYDTWIYDTGPAFSKRSSTQQAVLPYLRASQKANALTGLIVSHGDADHAGDIESLYAYAKPNTMLTSQPERLDTKGFELCRQGMGQQNANMKVQILYPLKNTDLSSLNSNNHSCVVRLTMMGKVFLLMGDLEGESELTLVSHYKEQLKADVLIAGHHGAAKSSSFALLKHVQPDHIVFSSGYMNKFGHPAAAVNKRISQFESASYNTAELGAILFRLEEESNQLVVTTAREHKANLWQVKH